MTPTRLPISVVVVLVVLAACGPSIAYAAWSGQGSGGTAAKARSMPTGNAPTATVAAQDVTVSWSASSFGDGTPVTGYTVTRYTAGNVAQTPSGGCATTVAGLTCTDTGVPAGTYTYKVTPRASNWVGTEGAASSPVTVAAANSPLRIATGSYVGNATDNRAITDPGFQPDVVVVKAVTAQAAVMRTSTISGDLTKALSGATALAVNQIQTLDTNGFTVGTAATVNSTGVTYHWTAYRAAAGTVKVGSYTGNGTTQSITGAGFSPEHVSVLPATAQRATQRFAAMTSGFQFDADAGNAQRVTALGADGFSVGTGAEVNASGTTYHYVAVNDVAGTIDVGSYVGNAPTDNRSIGGVGFQPDHVAIRSGDNRLGTFRPAALAGDSSLRFSAAAALANNVQALQADGFQIGADTAVNAAGVTFHYVAMKNTAGGCALPGPRTTVATDDAWVNQASPATNAGADTVLKVTSKSGSANTRAFVTFPLPALPAGCSVTAARMRLYNRSPVAGRTLQASQATGTWTENALTWNNQPTVGGTPASAAVPGAAGWMEWNVLTDLAVMYAGTNNGFRIADATENGAGTEQQLDSAEGTNKPELVVTFGG